MNINGHLLTHIEQLMKSWQQYVEQLFDEDRSEIPEVVVDMSGPAIVKEEVRQAVKKLKSSKAAGAERG